MASKVLRLGFIAIVGFVATGCASHQSTYRSEMQVASVGTTDVSGLSNAQIHAKIKTAYLDGELTAEQARKAHTQLNVRGHLTAEQIAMINRDRLEKRHQYESKKEVLDVIRDTAQTGTSVLGDINNAKNIIGTIFK